MRKKGFFIMLILFIFSLTFVSAEILFIRGDANFDQKLDLADSVFINNYLYKGGSSPYCMDASDVNDDGKVDLSDGVYLNNYLFLGTGSPPPAPYPDAGIDPTADSLDCGPEGVGAFICESWLCNDNIRETNEGPGTANICCPGSAPAGYEECANYKRASTAIVGTTSKVDYCLDAETLQEAWIDCAIGEDDLYYEKYDCNKENKKEVSYVCANGEIEEITKTYDYGCRNGACVVVDTPLAGKLISRVGDDDYCKLKKEKCGVGCTQEEYDCDSNSECATGLVCLGPEGGAADGCCKSGQIWDTTNFECDDCKPTDGPCCDSSGNFRPSTYVCNTNTGVTEYACKDGNCLDQDVWKRTKKQYCSGTSASCSGKIEPNNPTRQVDCTSTQFCSGSSSWTTTQPTCKTPQCTSGTCCDTTCGVYSYRPTSYVCGSTYEEGCPWGMDLGDNAGKRDGQQKCPGNWKDCTGQIVWGSWNTKDSCMTKEYCDITDSTSYCKAIACSQNSDCGTDGPINEPFCKDNNVWDKWRTWTCDNPGTKSSSCSAALKDQLKTSCAPEEVWKDEFFCENDDVYQIGWKYSFTCNGQACENTKTEMVSRLKEDCANGCETLSPISARCKGAPPPVTCSDGIKNQDETDIDCGGTICAKCPNTKSCKISNDCQSSYCNPSTLKCENPPATCTDNDKDGYGTSGSTGCPKSGVDCNDNNANINPGATEICGNGIDENCNGNTDDVCKCTNECSPQGSTKCSSSTTKQTCGNYDADACLEWGGDMNCQYGCSSNQCNAAPPCANGLYAYWKFNDLVRDGGRITDSSQTDHAGTLHTFDSFDKSVSGVQGFAQSFDGIDDYFEVSHSKLLEPGTGSFSISFWVYPDTNRENRMILSKVNGTLGVKFKGYGILLTDGGNLYAGFGDGDRKTEVYSPVVSSQWTHFVIVKDDPTDKVLIYKNGALYTSVSDPSQDVSYLVNIFVGRAYGPFKAFKGKLDEFAIFKRSLSPEEVRVFYTNGANARNLC